MDRAVLERMIEAGLSQSEIGRRMGKNQSTVAYWLRRYGLQTTPAARRHAARKVAPRERFLARCRTHGETPFVRYADRTTACLRCRATAVSDWRRRAKRRLVERAGGACERCGYDRCVAALQFHHRDPSLKEFALGSRGLGRSWAALTAEADKCALLCANCHAEVEAGAATLP